MPTTRGRADPDGSIVLPLWYCGPQYFFGSVPNTNVFVLITGHDSTAINPVVGSISSVIVPSRRLSGTGGAALRGDGDGNDPGGGGSSAGVSMWGVGSGNSSGDASVAGSVA